MSARDLDQRENSSTSPGLSGRRPGKEARGDAHTGSRHSRLADEIRPPLYDPDPDRARAVCAEICREILDDLAPVLLFFPKAERLRVQALAAHVRSVFDFALQSGLDGDRLASLNRWEFELEQALRGETAGQPVFVAMALCDAERPWDREALDHVVGIARKIAVNPDAARDLPTLAPALCGCLLRSEDARTLRPFAVALLRALRSRQGGKKTSHEHRRSTLVNELRRTAPASLSRPWLRALAFLSRIADEWQGDPERKKPPLSLSRRLGLLLWALSFRGASR